LTLHRHPIYHNTYGEPSDPSLPSNLTIGHGAPHLEARRPVPCLSHLEHMHPRAHRDHRDTPPEPIAHQRAHRRRRRRHGAPDHLRALDHRAEHQTTGPSTRPPVRAPDHRVEHQTTGLSTRPPVRAPTTVASTAGSAWRLLDSPIPFAEAAGNSRARRDHPAGVPWFTRVPRHRLHRRRGRRDVPTGHRRTEPRFESG